MSVRVLVTGAGGFIGRQVVAELRRRGCEVFGCGRGGADADATWITANLLDPSGVRGAFARARPEIVVHNAWFTAHGQFWTSPENAAWVAASSAVAQEALRQGARRFVGVGTGAEYASDAAMPLDERQSRIAPETLYGSAKDTTRRALEVICGARSFAWARVFMPYGAGEHRDRLVPSLSRALVRGEAARMSSGRVLRDFMDVRDVGAGLAALALSNVQGCVNVASGVPITVRAVGESLARMAGRPDLLDIGALPDRPNEPRVSFASVARLRDEVGFVPSIALEDGLREALEYWRGASLTQQV